MTQAMSDCLTESRISSRSDAGAYFEWSREDIERLTGDPDALGLAQGRHLRQFRDLAVRDDRDDGKEAKLNTEPMRRYLPP